MNPQRMQRPDPTDTQPRGEASAPSAAPPGSPHRPSTTQPSRGRRGARLLLAPDALLIAGGLVVVAGTLALVYAVVAR